VKVCQSIVLNALLITYHIFAWLKCKGLFRYLKCVKRLQAWFTTTPTLCCARVIEPLSRLFNGCLQKRFVLVSQRSASIWCDFLQSWVSYCKILQICVKKNLVLNCNSFQLHSDEAVSRVKFWESFSYIVHDNFAFSWQVSDFESKFFFFLLCFPHNSLKVYRMKVFFVSSTTTKVWP